MIRPTSQLRRRVLTLLAAALIGLLPVTLTASPSQAATASWTLTQGTTYPAIYQTNWVYFGTPFTAPATPTGAVIDTVGYKWVFAQIPPALRIYTVYLCAGTGGTQCLLVSPNLSTQAWTGTTSAFAGFPASTTFQYAVYIAAPTTYVLSPPCYSSSYLVTVNYTY